MFTGIIETTGKVINLAKQGSNYELTIECKLAPELKIDQSVAHNGVCLTVVEVKNNTYKVVVIEESLNKTEVINFLANLFQLLERQCLQWKTFLEKD